MNRLREAISKQLAAESYIDEIEKRVCQKVNICSGFLGTQAQIRKLEQIFKFYDSKNIGYLDYPNFFNALTKLNFVGVQRDVEGLFNRYDDDGTGYVEYKELSCCLYGLSMHPNFDHESRRILYELRVEVFDRHGCSGLFNLEQELQQYYHKNTQYSLLNMNDVESLLADYINTSSPASRKFLSAFDPNGIGMITPSEFIRAVKMGMSYDRKKIIAKIFNNHQQLENNAINKRTIMREFNPNVHPAVQSGHITSSEAIKQLQSCYNHDIIVSWTEFLDYFKYLSPAIEDDVVFEDVARQMFKTTTGKMRRILLTYYDGTQGVVEVDDVLASGIAPDMQAIHEKLHELGYHDVADVKL